MAAVPLVVMPGLLLPGLFLLMPTGLLVHNFSHASLLAASCAPVSLATVDYTFVAVWVLAAYLVTGLGACWAATFFKRKAMGAIEEGRHPFESMYMVKWTALNFSIIPLIHRLFIKPLRGSPFFNSFLRLNGARVGAHVLYLGVLEASCDFDMLNLEDFAVVEYNVRLQAHEVINAHVAHRPIKVGRRAHVGSRSNLLAGATMSPSARLLDQSLLLGRSHARPGQVWGGLPATLSRGGGN